MCVSYSQKLLVSYLDKMSFRMLCHVSEVSTFLICPFTFCALLIASVFFQPLFLSRHFQEFNMQIQFHFFWQGCIFKNVWYGCYTDTKTKLRLNNLNKDMEFFLRKFIENYQLLTKMK